MEKDVCRQVLGCPDHRKENAVCRLQEFGGEDCSEARLGIQKHESPKVTIKYEAVPQENRPYRRSKKLEAPIVWNHAFWANP